MGRAIDLNGVQIGRDTLLVDPVFPEGDCLEAAAGTHLLLARGSVAATNGGLPTVDATFGFSLVQSDGVLRVGFGGSDLDVVTWTSSTAGAAHQLDPDVRTPVGNDGAAHWCPATETYGAGTDHGTPGDAKGSCD